MNKAHNVADMYIFLFSALSVFLGGTFTFLPFSYYTIILKQGNDWKRSYNDILVKRINDILKILIELTEDKYHITAQ